MYIFDTHRSIVNRLSLSRRKNLGAGNFFWHVHEMASDRDRPLLYHPDASKATWDTDDIPTWSLNHIRAAVLRYAHWYRAHGVDEYCRVGIYTRDGIATFLHHIAITSLGAIGVPVNPKMPPAIAAAYFRRTQVGALIGDPDLLAACVRGGSRPLDLPSPALVEDVRTLDSDAVASGPLDDHPYEHVDADVVMLCHSSGTTGTPKATIFGHHSFFVGKHERLFTFPSRRSDRMLTALPHSHSAGLSYLMLATMLGLPTLVLDDTSGAAVVRAANSFLPTIVLGFPLTLADVPLEGLTSRAAATVHTWAGMGDASHERHIRPLLEAGGPGTKYLDGLGSSEMGMILFSHAHTPGSAAYGRAIGRTAGVVREAAALDERGRPLPPGQAGLLGVRTPSSTPGYWDDPDLTVRSLRHGYWLTGDVVRRDEHGMWYHLDRVPDVIETAGGSVYSLPLEEVVLLATRAHDTGVIGVDDPDHPGKACPIAVVLFKNGMVAEEPGTLLRRCNEALERKGLSRLRALVIAEDRSQLPVGVTGKVLKRELRQLHHALLQEPVRPLVAVERNEGSGARVTLAGAAEGGRHHGG